MSIRLWVPPSLRVSVSGRHLSRCLAWCLAGLSKMAFFVGASMLCRPLQEYPCGASPLNEEGWRRQCTTGGWQQWRMHWRRWAKKQDGVLGFANSTEWFHVRSWRVPSNQSWYVCREWQNDTHSWSIKLADAPSFRINIRRGLNRT